MKIESLKLKGFVGIKKGLGLDEVSLDLSGLSGLIALSGPNGKGKSSVLECMTPWRSLASRGGALQHHTYLRDSFKEIIWKWNGDHFRSLIKIDAQSEKSEAYLYKNEDPKPIANGNKNYDHCLRDILGSEELFFSSVFCAQNSEKLSDMTTGKLKALFSEFLRLDKLIAYEDLSKRCAVTLIGQAQALNNEGQYLEAETGKKQTLIEIERPAIQQRILAKQGVLDFAKDTIGRTELSLKSLRQRVEDNRVHEARLKDLQAQGKKLSADWEKEKAGADKAIYELKTKAKQVEQEIAATSKLIDRKDDIEFSVRKEKELQEDYQAINEECNQIQTLQKENIAQQYRNGKIEQSLVSEIIALEKDHQLIALKTSLANAKERMTLLDKKDPACTSTICSFIVNALQAKTEIPTLERAFNERNDFVGAQLRGKGIQLREIEDALSVGRKEEDALYDHEKSINAKLTTIKNDLVKVKALAALKSQLDTATAKLEGLQIRHKDVDAQIIETLADHLEKKDEYELFLIKNTRAIREAQALVDPLAAEDLQQEEAGLKDLLTAKESNEKEIASLRGDLAGLEAQIKACEEKERRLTEIQGKRRIILAEASQWEYLKNACSKDGLRALEIDSVAPTISAYANDLLSRTFGPLFQVRFRTQNDEGKEVLDILVIRDDGTETLLDNLSGGEKVWLLKSLRLAMTLVSKEKSGRALGTCFADEEDGSLDVENGQNFIQLYRSFLQSGGFDSMFFISHKPDCVDLADHVLRFNGGGIEIE